MKKGISRRNDAFHRYLKPGALAQIRNTRLNHRSSNSSSFTLSFLDRVHSPSPSTESRVAVAATPTMDQMPDLLSKTYGPSRIGRKKLSPARSVLRTTMMVLNPSSQNSTLESASNGNNNNVLSSIVDVLVAH